jgi:hypothetical protein
MVYGIYNELVTGAYKPTYILGASHCKNGEQILSMEFHGKYMENLWEIHGISRNIWEYIEKSLCDNGIICHQEIGI